jgi:hypothetical protein
MSNQEGNLAMGAAALLERLPTRDSCPTADTLFRMGLDLTIEAGGATFDSVAAHALFDLAARQGSIEAKIYRRELGEEMDVADVIDARRLAQEWLAGRCG